MEVIRRALMGVESRKIESKVHLSLSLLCEREAGAHACVF